MSSGTLSPPSTKDRSDDLAKLPVVAARHPWRWVGVVAVLVLVAQFVHGLVTNPAWDWPTFARYFTARSILTAVGTTIVLTVLGTVLGLSLIHI